MRLSNLLPRTILVIFVLVSSSGLVACWDDAEQIDQVAWSDDDQRQAYIKLLFEESHNSNPLSGTSNKRNFRHQVFVQNSSGGFQALTGERPNQNGASFYFMRDAGYIMFDVIESGSTTRWDVIRLATGTNETVARFERPSGPAIPCHHMEALPSATGDLIALIERVPVGGTGPEACANGTTTVTFLDAASLSTIATHSWQMSAMPEVYWSDEDVLYVWGYLDGSWRVDPAAGPIEAPRPNCTWPRTSSSPLSYEGVMIGPGPNGGDPIDVVNDEHENCRGPE